MDIVYETRLQPLIDQALEELGRNCCRVFDMFPPGSGSNDYVVRLSCADHGLCEFRINKDAGAGVPDESLRDEIKAKVLAKPPKAMC